MTRTREPSGPHDIGGLEGGPVDQAEHELSFWDWRIDAMVRLLLGKGVLVDFAELRHGIESLPPDAYETMSYYERWAASVASVAIRKGIVTQAELDARIAILKARAAEQQKGGAA